MGRRGFATFWVDAAILVEYYCLEPFYCYVKDGRNRTQNEKIAQEWRDKGHKVKYIDNEYTARFYVDRYHNNGKYYWWILRDFGGKKVNDIELIRKKLVRLNAGIFR